MPPPPPSKGPAAFARKRAPAPAPPISVGLLVMWAGGSLPAYSSWACASILPSATIATLWLVVDNATAQTVPTLCHEVANVRVVELGRGGVASALAYGLISARHLGPASPAKAGDSHASLSALIMRTLISHPDVIVELKPAWLLAMRRHLVKAGHTHATVTDLDCIFGNLEKWLLPSMVLPYDVVTWGEEGDSMRLFLRGQFTLIPLIGKRATHILSRFTRCSFLSERVVPFLELRKLANKFPVNNLGNSHWHSNVVYQSAASNCSTHENGALLSAEACFSCVILTGLPSLRVLFRPIQLSPLQNAPIFWRNGSLQRCAALNQCPLLNNQHLPAPRSDQHVFSAFSKVDVERPCRSISMSWLRATPNSLACVPMSADASDQYANVVYLGSYVELGHFVPTMEATSMKAAPLRGYASDVPCILGLTHRKLLAMGNTTQNTCAGHIDAELRQCVGGSKTLDRRQRQQCEAQCFEVNPRNIQLRCSRVREAPMFHFRVWEHSAKLYQRNLSMLLQTGGMLLGMPMRPSTFAITRNDGVFDLADEAQARTFDRLYHTKKKKVARERAIPISSVHYERLRLPSPIPTHHPSPTPLSST